MSKVLINLSRAAAIAGCFGGALLFSTSSTAQENKKESEAENGSGFIVIGAGALPEFEGSEDFRIVPLIVARVEAFGTEIEIDGLQGRLNFVKNSVWRAGAALSVSIPRYDDVTAMRVAALPEVNLAVELGGFVGFQTPFGNATEGTLSGFISARQDVTGNHDGLLITTDIEYFFAANKMLRFGIGVNATYASDKYMETYFSVDAVGAVASTLDEFQAGGGLKDAGAEVYSILSLSQNWGVFSRVSYNRLFNDAANSPVVKAAGSRDQYFFGGGIFYRF
jgi:outer membrane protein